MNNRRTPVVLAILAPFILVGSILYGMDTRASEPGTLREAKSLELAAPGPDLIVSRIELLTVTATSVDYLFVTKNIGDVTADLDGILPDLSDDVYYQAILSNDTIYGNSGDRGAGSGPQSQMVTELAPGEEYTHTSQSALQDVYYFDYGYFMVKVDAYGDLVEDNEDNNVGVASLPDGPDLIVENVKVLSIDSSDVVYQFTVRNIGDGLADLDGPNDVDPFDNVNFRGVLSPDDILDNAGDKAVGGSYILSPAVLNPGKAFTHTFSAGMGGANYLDFHYLFVEVDGFDNLGETNEDNNIGMTEILWFIHLPLIIH